MSNSASAALQPAHSDVTAATQAGRVRGTQLDGVSRFYAVPYAAPPVGDRRFALPAAVPAWDGIRDALVKGPVAPQVMPSPEEFEKAMPGLDIAPLVGDGLVQGDDFLLANIWTPDVAGRAPVMVFIHGGAFTGGCGTADVYDGAALARAGVVCVTINYRLGIEGFLPIPGAPTNLGLRDQIFALAWVRDNIAAFGGDASNVTVFGESAGAMSIANLVGSPLAQGLFRRAIIQSGHGALTRPIAVAQRLTKKLAKMLKISADVAGFRSRPVAETLQAQRKISLPTARIDLRDADKREPAFGLSRFLPVHGDDVLPEPTHAALNKGVGNGIDVLIGTNKEEMNLYFVPSGVRRKIGKFLANFLVGRAEPKAREILKAYGLNDRAKRPGDAFTEALTDLVFRLQARKFARAHQGRTHFYEFAWRSPAYDGALGACHGMELPFAFNTLSTVNGPRGLAGQNPPQDVADRIMTIWVNYAKTGDLPWPEYRADTQLVCTIDTGAVSADAPMPAERILA
jgi:para-nitrobenzyl esterase